MYPTQQHTRNASRRRRTTTHQKHPSTYTGNTTKVSQQSTGDPMADEDSSVSTPNSSDYIKPTEDIRVDSDPDDGETELDDEVILPVTPPTRIGSVRFQGTQEDNTTTVQTNSKTTSYRQRRLALMISIPEVDNNADRLDHIVLEVNQFLKAARKKNAHFRLRKFDEISHPDPKDRKNWRTKMTQDSSADFKEYIQGYYPFTPPRGGQYRLRLNTVMDASMPLATFLENVTHDWGQKDSRSISDLKAQRIWDPVKVGYLMRASRYITHSYELVDALEKAANAHNTSAKIYFGVSWGTIPSPVGGYDKETAVQAVMIETNKASLETAVALMKRWYPLDPSKPSEPPFPGNFRFVLNRDNIRVKGNPVALANLSILMERQGIFNLDTRAEQTFCLQDLNMPYKGGNSMTVREKLLKTKVRTMGNEMNGSPVFLSISTAVNNRNGTRSVWFTFHKKVAQEAISIVRNLPIFIHKEWNILPEYVCYAQFITPSNTWDKDKRVANNEDTDDIKMAAEVHTLDLKRTSPEVSLGDDKNDDDDNSMTTKARREMMRMMANEEETIASMSRPKSVHPRPAAIVINDDASQGAISGFSGASSKSSVIRARMQQEFDEKMERQQAVVTQLQKEKEDQQKQQDALARQVAQLQEALANLNHPALSNPTNINTDTPNQPDPDYNWNTQDTPLDLEPDFDCVTGDADFAEIVARIENRIVSQLDHSPTKEELISIGIEAQKLAVDFDSIANEAPGIPLPPSPPSGDSTSEELSPRRTNRTQRLHITTSDEADDKDVPMATKDSTLKRLAMTPSDDTDDKQHGFITSASTAPKKKTSTTGGRPPMGNV